ncbi:MAG: DUF928 domain-containing protein [Tolypothrix brevis GSE-NOS-MK-07-07A]|jgi:hypothetical protein|nr:DUF928 domain-containing protein [Tolypothrix brevis GSE-NOS-MK-07-07A]MBW4480761.1 DUF928 domain-containing protein [Tolypothrix brevis GSE-NOS-MK-07-07A]
MSKNKLNVRPLSKPLSYKERGFNSPFPHWKVRSVLCYLKLTFITLLFLSLATSQVQAQSFTIKQNKPADQQFPDDGDPTGRRRGGTSRRGDCPILKMPLTALVPGEETNNKSFLGTTISEYPSFWVYIPELPSDIRSGEFVLQDQKGNDIWRTPITLTGKAGAISVKLPRNSQYALKPNLKYHWYFNIYCNPTQKNSVYFVDAWVRRVTLTPQLQQQLNKAKSREYKVYIANNIWYDAVSNLGELRRNNPGVNVFLEDWAKLLKSVNLPELAPAPIVQIYTPNK